MAKTIEDYQREYQAANLAGDYDGMRAANDGANAIRRSLGQEEYSSAVGDRQRADLVASQKATIRQSIPGASLYGGVEAAMKAQDEASRRQKAMIEDQFSNMISTQRAANQAAVNVGVQNLRNTNTQGQQQFDAAAAESAITTRQNLDNLALRSASLGDLGGVGQKQYSESLNAGDQRLLEINLGKKNLEMSTAQQVAALRAEGKMAEADMVANLGMKQLEMLVAEEDKILQLKRDQELVNAEMYGTYYGQPTMKTQQSSYEQALQRLERGMFTEQDAMLLGMTPDQAKRYADDINTRSQLEIDVAKLKLQQAIDAEKNVATGGRGGTAAVAEEMPEGAKTRDRAMVNEMIQRWYQANTKEKFENLIKNKVQAGVISWEDYEMWRRS